MKELQSPSPSKLADIAVQSARAAGSVLMETLGRDRQIEHKGIIDLVTDADRLSEQTVVSVIRHHFPHHQILAEEGTTGGQDSPYRWIIDPLDGTTNYAHRYPHFAVSIGLELDGEILTGAVYDPVRDELFTATAGCGAALNGLPLAVSRTNDLLHSLLCTGFPYDRNAFGPNLRRWERFIRSAQAVRRDGSAALDICYVAAGRFDGFWEDHLRPWDAAAGMLILKEAGGRLSDFRGGAPDLYGGEFVTSNGLIHDQMLAVLAEAQEGIYAGDDGTE